MRERLMVRDRVILYVLAGLGIAKSLDLAFLAGFSNHAYCRKRLYILKELGFVNDSSVDREKVYFLTKEGYMETERETKGYEFNCHTFHDIAVARIATYLYISQGISYRDMLTDRQMKYFLQGTRIHRPDLVVGHTAYEYERTLKKMPQIVKNVESNTRYKKQVWIVPGFKRIIKQRLMEAAHEVHTDDFQIIDYEDILYMVTEDKLKTNELRNEPVLGERDIKQLTRPNMVGEWSKYLEKGR